MLYRLGHCGNRVLSLHHPLILPWRCGLSTRIRCHVAKEYVDPHLLLPSLMVAIGFTNARSWLADVREHADPHLTCILVGNKVDLASESDTAVRKREVTTEEAELWAQEEGLLFVEASAKSGQNVERAFEQAAKDILDKIKQGVFDDERSPGVKLSKPNSNSLTLEQAPGKTTCCS